MLYTVCKSRRTFCSWNVSRIMYEMYHVRPWYVYEKAEIDSWTSFTVHFIFSTQSLSSIRASALLTRSKSMSVFYISKHEIYNFWLAAERCGETRILSDCDAAPAFRAPVQLSFVIHDSSPPSISFSRPHFVGTCNLLYPSTHSDGKRHSSPCPLYTVPRLEASCNRR